MIERNGGRITFAEKLEAFDEPSVSLRVSVGDGKLRNTGTRVGQCKARCQAQPRCVPIDSEDPQRALLFLDDDERALCFIRPGAIPASLQPVG